VGECRALGLVHREGIDGLDGPEATRQEPFDAVAAIARGKGDTQRQFVPSTAGPAQAASKRMSGGVDGPPNVRIVGE
jgi:hypothetical protein